MKTSFTDTKSRPWNIEVTVASIKRVKAMLGVDLTRVFEDAKVINELVADPVALCDVLYALCHPQCVQAGVNDEEFGSGMAGDSIRAATEALVQALIGFQQSPAVRAAFGRMMEAQARSQRTLEARLEERVTDEAIEQVMAPVLEKASRAIEDIGKAGAGG